MKWYVLQFDRNWVQCRNYKCKVQFTAEYAKHKYKCPRCKINNYGEIK